jgi:20S proteasome subunit alpha 2
MRRICQVLSIVAAVAASTPRRSALNEQRYSFSLTTFDPDGRLGQVIRASTAASRGVPIVASIVQSNDSSPAALILLAPQVLPSPYMVDDGTARFIPVTSEILVTHTGLSADGRVLCAAAQRLAIEHKYTFDPMTGQDGVGRGIPIRLFLEEMSLLMQEYTYKPGARPFGVTLIIGYVPQWDPTRPKNEQRNPRLFRIDPSGVVQELESSTVVNGGGVEATSFAQGLETSREPQDLRRRLLDLVDAFRRAQRELATQKRMPSMKQPEDGPGRIEVDAEGITHDHALMQPMTILSATMLQEQPLSPPELGRFRLERHE